ncbi:hypothetical protein D3C75_775940 [compost metagenome]
MIDIFLIQEHFHFQRGRLLIPFFLEQMIEKNHHPKPDPQRIGNLEHVGMLIPPSGQHLDYPDVHLLHVDIGMEIHNGQRRSEEQQQPYKHEQGNRWLTSFNRPFNLHNGPPLANRLDIGIRYKLMDTRDNGQQIDQNQIPVALLRLQQQN